tara:strand:+ start:449 stop:733 length:285 start_codon:yes stop_codon:yes gene_type:complete
MAWYDNVTDKSMIEINRLRTEYSLLPKDRLFGGFRGGKGMESETPAHREIMAKIYKIIDFYDDKVVSSPELIASKLKQRQKDAMARAIKQLNSC